MAIEAPDDDAGDDMPEISIDADEKLRYWRGKLDQTPKLKKRDVFELAAGDIFAEAENEHDLRAYQAITDAVYALGSYHAGLHDDDIQFIMVGAKGKAERPINGHANAEFAEVTSDEPSPELVINEADPTAAAKQLAALIARRNDVLFNGYAPVRIAVEADELPRAIELTTEFIRVYAHKICRPVKLREKKDKKTGEIGIEKIPVPLSKDIAQLYLNGLEGEWGLASFRGIATAPILRDDGSIRIAAGYDSNTGLWCHNIPDLEIPEHPTEAQAREALRYLREFFQTFPYADGARLLDEWLSVEITDFNQPIGLDESTFLVALLTAVCRQSLELAPAFLVRAPTFSGAGTGKGLAVKAKCIVASGARPAAFTSGHDSEEFDKRLTSSLVEARPAVFLDNFNAKELKSDILASCLTEYPAMVRPMGQTKMVPLHTRTFVAITGNAIDIAEDMARRIIVANFDARMESPETRQFAPGFLDDVFAARSQLLAAALTIWRWGRQAKLKRGKPLGSYELWARWCRDPLLALGCRDPIDRLTEIKAADPRRRMLVTLFEAWWTIHGDATLKATDLNHEVVALIPSRSETPSRQVVASFLRKRTNARVGGYLLEHASDTGGRPSRATALYQLKRNEP
jgi:putative DNA primase/helicase